MRKTYTPTNVQRAHKNCAARAAAAVRSKRCRVGSFALYVVVVVVVAVLVACRRLLSFNGQRVSN